MLAEWLEFGASAVGGAAAFICLFEGVRRIAAHGAHRTAIFMTAGGALFCIFYGAASYWKHHMLLDVSSTLQRRMFPNELPDGWCKDHPPEKCEASSTAIAQMAFVESGEIRTYFHRSGERRLYVLTRDDVQKRELAVVTVARLDDQARANYTDGLLWLVWALVAILFGFGIGREKPGLPANTTPHTDARDAPASASGSGVRAGGRER